MFNLDESEEIIEYFVFEIELEKFAKDVNYKIPTTKLIQANTPKILLDLNHFVLKNYSQLKDDKLCLEIFGDKMIGFIENNFYDDIYLLKLITVGLYLIRKLINTTPSLNSNILFISFNTIREELFLMIKDNILYYDQFNIKMALNIEISYNEKIFIDSNEIINEKKNNNNLLECKNFELEEKVKELSQKSESIKANQEIMQNLLKQMKEMQDVQKNTAENMEKFEDKIRKEHEGKIEKLIQENKEDKEKLHQEHEGKIEKLIQENKEDKEKLHQEHEGKIDKLLQNNKEDKIKLHQDHEEKIEKLIQENKKEVRKLIQENEEKIKTLETKVEILFYYNNCLWLRKIISKIYVIIKKVHNLEYNPDEDKKQVIQGLAGKDFFQYFSSKDFDFSATILKLIDIQEECHSVAHLNNKNLYNGLCDPNNKEDVIDIIKKHFSNQLEENELNKLKDLLKFINYKANDLYKLDHDYNINRIKRMIGTFN